MGQDRTQWDETFRLTFGAPKTVERAVTSSSSFLHPLLILSCSCRLHPASTQQHEATTIALQIDPGYSKLLLQELSVQTASVLRLWEARLL
ncbi:hypothetical protein C1H46_007140 [Malus baccata]|uniref:Uncharacterized protein n=1 Tax=Malus baccata TaxID=106549 RepID=A0A540N9R7_MALBA|nr:hypothetical protein C1H46_007140 [Malus baccata]